MFEQLKDRRLQGIYSTYQMDKGIFNIGDLDAQKKKTNTLDCVLEFQYVDDAIVCAQFEKDRRVIVENFLKRTRK